MKESILDTSTLEFIQSHLEDEPAALMLQAHRFPGIALAVAVEQIASRQKAKKKWPSWQNRWDLIFPAPLSVEQSSSEKTAEFKSQLVTFNSFADLTGGSGIDFLAFLQKAKKGHFVESQPQLCKLAHHNFPLLSAVPFVVHEDSAENFLQNSPPVDLIYLDPARRDAEKKKVFRWEDLSPNAISLLPTLLEKTEQVLIKGSPMVDIAGSLSAFDGQVNQVWVVALDGEVKEVLLLIKREKTPKPKIHAVDLSSQSADRQILSSEWAERSEMAIELPKKGDILLEPSAAIMKAAVFSALAQHYQLSKLHPHTHLFLAEKAIQDFQGRQFVIRDILPVRKKELKNALPMLKANLSIRNFPSDVANLKKTLSLKDGGEDYLFACTLKDGSKVLLLTEKL